MTDYKIVAEGSHMNSSKWDLRYIDLARHISHWSKDPRKQVGAVITDKQYVRGIGFNGFPRGIEDSEQILNDKTAKLKLVVHAEANAILTARGLGDTIYIYIFGLVYLVPSAWD